MKGISEKDVDSDMEIQKEIFDINPSDLPGIRGISRMYLALKKIVKEKNIQAYAPECWPEFRDVDETPFCPANSRMTVQGVMASCECDIDGALTMMLGYALTGNSVFFADFVNFIQDNNTILFWHCGNAPYDLATSKPVCQKIFGGLSLSTPQQVMCAVSPIVKFRSITLSTSPSQAVTTVPMVRFFNWPDLSLYLSFR